VRKVTGNGEGASLLREPRRLQKILKAMAGNSPAPVTVKIRSGWDEASVNARDVALHAQDAGISALFIHGRTRAQQYSGIVDYGVIAEVKEALEIPVVASGDVLSPELAKRMFDETGCDGVLMARGALGNPWIFNETAEFMKSGTLPPRPGTDEITGTMKQHLRLCVEFHGPQTGGKLFRKLFIWYTRGLPGIKPLREKAMHAGTEEALVGVIDEAGAAAPHGHTAGSLR
jgi:nifR3 family TIM-barrel protein